VNPARVAMVLAPGVAMLALASLPLYAADRCGFADHAAATSAARDRVLKGKPFVLPGSPLHGARHELDSCALLAFSIDAHGRAWRIVVKRPGPAPSRPGRRGTPSRATCSSCPPTGGSDT